jgi:hypothetical protein
MTIVTDIRVPRLTPVPKELPDGTVTLDTMPIQPVGNTALLNVPNRDRDAIIGNILRLRFWCWLLRRWG